MKSIDEEQPSQQEEAAASNTRCVSQLYGKADCPPYPFSYTFFPAAHQRKLEGESPSRILNKVSLMEFRTTSV